MTGYRMSRTIMPKERAQNKRLAEPVRKRRMGSLYKASDGVLWWTSYGHDAHYTKTAQGWANTYDWPDDATCVDPSYLCPFDEKF